MVRVQGLVFAGAFLVGCLAVGSAQATAFCEVLPTRDGFVTLRAGPGPSTRALARLKPGEMVQLDSTRAAKRGWEPVYLRREGEAPVVGWVRRTLIEKECG